jgi:hypothetical protein
MKISVPWQIRLPSIRSGSPRSGSWWNRRHFKDKRSAPTRSVLMQKDDLDHLGALHDAMAKRRTKS